MSSQNQRDQRTLEADQSFWSTITMSFNRVPLDSLAVSGSTCAAALREKIVLVDLNDPSVEVARLKATSKWIPHIARLEFNPHKENSRFLASTFNTEVLIWDTTAGKLLNAWKLHSRPLSSIHWSYFDANILASCSNDKYMRLVDIRTKKPIMALSGGTGASIVRWSPRMGSTLASTHDGSVKIWDTRMAAMSQSITAHTSKITSIDWSPTVADEFVTTALASHDQSVRFFSLKRPNQPVAAIRTNSAYRAFYTPFGRGVVTSTRQDTSKTAARGILLWSVDAIFSGDTASATPVATFHGHLYDWWLGDDKCSQPRIVVWNSGLNVSPIDEAVCRAIGVVPTSPVEDEECVAPSEQKTVASRATDAPGSQTSSSVIGALDRIGATAQKTIEGSKTMEQELHDLQHSTMRGISVIYIDNDGRACEIKAKASARHKRSSVLSEVGIHLKTVFPPEYPKGVPPLFQLVSLTGVNEADFQNAISVELAELAAAYVRNHKTCLHPCLQLLVELLEDRATAMRDLRAKVAHGSPVQRRPSRNDTHQDGDVVYRVARTSGACFCGSTLVFFSNAMTRELSRDQGMSSEKGSVGDVHSTGGSSSKSSSQNHREASQSRKDAVRSGVGRSGVSNFFYGSSSKRKSARAQQPILSPLARKSMATDTATSHGGSGTPSTGPAGTPAAVALYDLSSLLMISPTLASEYCTRAPVPTEESEDVPSSNKAVGAAATCVHNGEVARAAGRQDLARLWKVAALALDQRITCGKSDPHSTLPWTLQPCGGKAIEQLLSFALKQRDIQTAAVLACVVTQTRGQTDPALLPSTVVSTYGYVQLSYAEVLGRWGLRTLAAAMRQAGTLAVRGHMQPPSESLSTQHMDDTGKSPTIASQCRSCLAFQPGSVCTQGSCGTSLVNRCSVCRRYVRQRMVFCLDCGHGGHSECMALWFDTADSTACATGCGCLCREPSPTVQGVLNKGT
eukprot:m.1101403 g.1101403  ORF g.1101403 m.1101403 type:complete len:965 (-) comp24323_c0_seq3:1963-4857(-)